MRCEMPRQVKTIKSEIPAAAAARLRELSEKINAELAEIKEMIEAETGCSKTSVFVTGMNSNTFGEHTAKTKIEVSAELGSIWGPRHEQWKLNEEV